MGNRPVTTSANVMAASARILIAPLGTALPTVATTGVLTWVAAWKECGATEKGTDLSYTPSLTDVKIDESASPIAKLLASEKCILSCVLAESTLINLGNAIAADTQTITAPGVGTPGSTEMDLGGGAVAEVMVGLEGLNPTGLPRYLVGYKAVASAAVKLAFQRAAITTVPLSIELLADTTKALGSQLVKIVDITAIGE
jgi:hypothetical protein